LGSGTSAGIEVASATAFSSPGLASRAVTDACAGIRAGSTGLACRFAVSASYADIPPATSALTYRFAVSAPYADIPANAGALSYCLAVSAPYPDVPADARAFAYRFSIPAPDADIPTYASAFAKGCAFTKPGSTFLRETAGTHSRTHAGVESSLCWPVYPTAPAIGAAPTDAGPLGEAATIPAGTVPTVEVEAIGPTIDDMLPSLRSV